MSRTLLIGAIIGALLAACTQTAPPSDYERGTMYHHGGGSTGPSFNTPIRG